jgi:hypothetical protein
MYRRRIGDAWEFLIERAEPIPESGCWLWRGKISRGGYGQIRDIGGGYAQAHRFVYRLFKGEIPDGLFACHRCDVRSCVNPNHIFLGTHSDNIQDATEKGRIQSGRNHWRNRTPDRNPRGTQIRTAKLNDDLVRFIRSDPRSSSELSRLIGVSSGKIREVRRGLVWRHVPMD